MKHKLPENAKNGKNTEEMKCSNSGILRCAGRMEGGNADVSGNKEQTAGNDFGQWTEPENCRLPKTHELLAPAGSLEICKAVLNAGADAVYLGGDKFGARAFAKNFSQDDIIEALDFAHLRGKKIFLTVNTLLKNREIDGELFDYLAPLYRHGLDAVIVQDYGVFQFIRRNFPELPLHVSTQMSVANACGAKVLKEVGAARIVTARELSCSEIRRIYDETGVEIESFIHGALCYCYSGQCLMSSMLGGRSGNRGRCAQPCRLAYQVTDQKGITLHKKEKYPLSPKDLCAISQLPKLCESGIYSFKIEGRMKKMEYAAGVTAIYREYLDRYEADPENYRVDEADIERLLQLGNRSGFTGGYYEMRNGREMMALTDSSHSSKEAGGAYCPPEEKKIPIRMRAIAKAGQPLQLFAALDEGLGVGVCPQEKSRQVKGEKENGKSWSVSAVGEPPQAAQSRPLSAEEFGKRLKKTGDTPFAVTSLEVDLDDGLFVPVGQINELRRSALDALKEKLLSGYRRPMHASKDADHTMPFENSGRTAQAVLTAAGRNAADSFSDIPGDSVGKNVFGADIKTKSSFESEAEKKNAGNGPYGNPDLNVWISNPAMMEELLNDPLITMITLEDGIASLQLAERIHAAGKQAGIALPYVLRENSEVLLKKTPEWWDVFDRIWARSFDGLGFLQNEVGVCPEKIALDAGLYVFSDEAAGAFLTHGYGAYTVSLEQNQKELAHMPLSRAELLLYGYPALMVSAQCVYKNYDCCIREHSDAKQNRRLYLTDRYQKTFAVKRDCRHCYNLIYNSQPISLFHQAEQIRPLGCGSYRIVFTGENQKERRAILDQYRQAFWENRKVKPPAEGSFTNGHFRRGVD